MKNIKKTLVVLILCSFIVGTIPVSVLAQQNSLDNKIFEHKGPDLPSGVEYAPDQIIVKFKAGTSDDTISVTNSKNKVVSSEKIMKKNPKAVENEKTKILKKHGLDRIYLLKLPKNSDVNKIVSKYNENPDVEYAEPNHIVHIDTTIPDDTYFSLLWGMHNTGQSGGTVDADIDAPEAWDITTGSSDIVVAVIDTGVDYNHSDLAANMWINPNETLNGNDDDGNGYIDDIRGWDFFSNDNNPYDQSGHGTHCSGTIAAEANNGIGVAGVSWNAKIMPLRFLGPNGGSTNDAVLAIIYAIDNGADIMSNSWGGGGYSETLEGAISAANDAGILFVASAGNAGTDNDVYTHYPSNYDVPNVISVAATDRNDNLASSISWASNYGATSVDLAAPGVTIGSTYPDNRYVYMSGTSMAAPHVAGAAALIKAQYPDITVDALKAKILDSVDPIPSLSGITVTGGRLNAYNALDAVNDAPIANDDTDTTSEDTLVTTTVLSNDSDPDGDALEVTAVTDPANGSAVINGDSTVKYTPDANFNGADSYVYTISDGNGGTDTATVTITVGIVNDALVANDDTDTTPEDTAVTTAVLDNDSDPDGDTLTVTTVTDPANGSAVINGDSTVKYTPDANFNGADSYVYTISDGNGGTDTATVTITVTCVNDPPVAVNDTDTTPEDMHVTVNVLANDYDVDLDSLTVTTVSNPLNGAAVINPNNTVTYTPDIGYNGPDSFTYEICDTDGFCDTGTVTIIVTEANPTMHIASIDVSFTSEKKAGPNIFGYATAVVTIKDENSNLVPNATVSGHWSGATSDIDSDITDNFGNVSLYSDTAKVRSGDKFTFTVDNVTHSDFIYNASANVEYYKSTTLP